MSFWSQDVKPTLMAVFFLGWWPLSAAALYLVGGRAQLLGAASFALLVFILVKTIQQRAGVQTPPWFATKGWEGSNRFYLVKKVMRVGTDVVMYHALDIARRFNFETWAISLPALTVVSIHSPENIKHVLETKFDNYVKGRYFHKVFVDALGDGIFNSDGMPWKKARVASSHLFSSWQLENRMLEVFQRHAEQLVDILRKVPAGETVDIQKLMYCYTFDCIYEIAFGRAVNSLGGNERDVEFQKAFDRVQAITAGRFLSATWVVQKALGLWSEGEMQRSLRIIREYVRDVIQERKRDKIEYDASDLISILERAIQEEEGRSYSDDEIIDFITNFTIAGRDTTAAVCTWMFYELSKHPEHKKRLEEEFARETDVKDMQFTQAVFQETLRMWPSVPFDIKFAVNDDVLPCGAKVKAGSAVLYAPMLFNRNPANFERPDDFLPDRWMENDGMCKKYDMKGFTYPAFNAGPRTCLGRHMAAVEAKTLLSYVMSEFDIEVVEGFEPRWAFTVVLQSRNGLEVKVTPKKR
eukprot:TRINITY_DN745_c0_g1_i11.p1 TRINITY_DN745_c0_g1~~TRINITY_DN745_c0_g1_i11.p1  ORF type:complete len:535 (+),score=217.11 TRINITY_DN745_c0_g1_i11:35-1606(+)